MVAAELGIGALQRRVSRGLGLLDAKGREELVNIQNVLLTASGAEVQSYPLRCALRDWLCCEEFLDSAIKTLAKLSIGQLV